MEPPPVKMSAEDTAVNDYDESASTVGSLSIPVSISKQNDGPEPLSERPQKARRKQITHHACFKCRQAKAKCDGRRETCGRCEKLDADCEYEFPSHEMTKMQYLQQMLDTKTEKYDKMVAVVKALQSASDSDATLILARMRLGASIDELLALEEGNDPLSERSDTLVPSSSRKSSVTLENLSPVTPSNGSWAPWSATYGNGSRLAYDDSGQQSKQIVSGPGSLAQGTKGFTGLIGDY